MRSPDAVSETNFTAFRAVPRTGVIYVTTEAQKLGFRYGALPAVMIGQERNFGFGHNP